MPQFLSRSDFPDSECREWSIINAWNFDLIDTHVAFRTVRFDTGLIAPLQEELLEAWLRLNAPRLVHEAWSRG